MAAITKTGRERDPKIQRIKQSVFSAASLRTNSQGAKKGLGGAQRTLCFMENGRAVKPARSISAIGDEGVAYCSAAPVIDDPYL
jgi:hypothetical protein